jgi:hypothetical protein
MLGSHFVLAIQKLDKFVRILNGGSFLNSSLDRFIQKKIFLYV